MEWTFRSSLWTSPPTTTPPPTATTPFEQLMTTIRTFPTTVLDTTTLFDQVESFSTPLLAQPPPIQTLWRPAWEVISRPLLYRWFVEETVHLAYFHRARWIQFEQWVHCFRPSFPTSADVAVMRAHLDEVVVCTQRAELW